MKLHGQLKLEEAPDGEYIIEGDNIFFLKKGFPKPKSSLYKINLYVGGKLIPGELPVNVKKNFILQGRDTCILHMDLRSPEGQELQLVPKVKEDILCVFSYTNTQSVENQLGCNLVELKCILKEYRLLIEECGDCFDTEVEKQFLKDIGIRE